MKKVIFGLLIILGLAAGSANAQITGGIKVNVNMSNFITSDINDMNSKMKVGGSLGGFMTIDLGDRFVLQPELLVNMSFSEFKDAGIKGDYEYWGLELPVYFVNALDSGNHGKLFPQTVSVGIGYKF